MQDHDLDDLFDLARRTPPQVGAGLYARIEADALDLQAARAAVPRAAGSRRGRSVWGGLVAALGGRGVLAGLASATLAGVWLGVAQPTPVSALTDALSGVLALDAGFDRVELIPALDPFVTEG